MSNARDKANIPSLNFSSTGIDDNATSTAITINSSENVGVGTSSPSAILEAKNATDGSTFVFQATNDNDHEIVQIGAQSDGDGYLTVHGQGASTNIKVQLHSDGDSYFTGGNVGIGTSSPSNVLHIKNSNPNIRLEDSDGSSSIYGQVVSNGSGDIQLIADPNNSGGSTKMTFSTDGSEAMRINSSGNVGIGTSSPSEKLTIYGTETTGGVEILLHNVGTDGGSTVPYTAIKSKLSLLRNGGEIRFGRDSTYGSAGTADSNLQFYTALDDVNTERMRIDSSGNVLVGKTTVTSPALTQGIHFTSNGEGYFTADGDNALQVSRLTSEGEIVSFRKDGTIIGSIGVKNADIYICSSTSGHAGLTFTTSNRVVPTDNTGSVQDNAVDLGVSSARFDDIFATNGTIQTSDQNEKQSIQSLTTAEMNVAKRLSPLIKTFKWNSSVEEKGDSARTHTGIIAQDVQQAFTDEGLDAGNYALFISDTWWEKEISVDAVQAQEAVYETQTDEEGNEIQVLVEEAIESKDAYTYMDIKEEATDGYTERTRLGVRYPELLSFIQAYNDQRFTELEARITTLENA